MQLSNCICTTLREMPECPHPHFPHAVIRCPGSSKNLELSYK